ncbi:MAG: hypothetical protein OHK0046_43360 [Anaerolineae bacterium]
MPILPDYTQFDGRYWDTGVIRNALDYQGVKAPHTGEPYTEALLLGISGGVTFGYFTFHYEGYDPQVNLLTRNTFEPMQTIFERLKLPREVLQTQSAEKARTNLITAIEAGQAPIVWADMFMLPYNALLPDAGMWGSFPLIVYGYDPGSEAQIADRSYVGLTVAADALDEARGRVKADKHRLMLLEHPDNSQLEEAVRLGIQDCIALMTEKPPRGSSKNFGLSGLQHWADMLEKTSKDSWAVRYPTGRPLLAVLMSAYTFLSPAFGKTMQAERDTYADFLDEAAVILHKPELENVAARYRMAGRRWDGLLCALLPEDVDLLKKAREVIDMKHYLFMEKGSAQIDDMLNLERAAQQLKNSAETDFPLRETETAELRAEIRRHVLMVHDAEAEAVTALKAAL